jgi:hypothetical protein
VEYWIWAHWFILIFSIIAQGLALKQAADQGLLILTAYFLITLIYHYALFAGGFW